jgi:hypothetical protein
VIARPCAVAISLPLALAGLASCGGHGKTPAAPKKLTLADNGRVVNLALGQQAVVSLDTLAWTFHVVVGSAVRAAGPQERVRQTRGCTAPNGCGTVMLTVKAVARGRSEVIATRGTCGEAARCPPAERTYTLALVVR